MAEQRTETIQKEELVERVARLKEEGCRLAQIGCTRLDGIEVNYSFDRDYEFLNLRLVVPAEGARIPSVSSVYWNAFLYENEMHDLFGIEVEGMALDYKGNFYRMKVKRPFNPPAGDPGKEVQT